MTTKIIIKYEDQTWNKKDIPEDEYIKEDMLIQGLKRALENIEEGYIQGELFYHFEDEETVSGWWNKEEES